MTRLRVQPLTPDLLRAVVPASTIGVLENLSYHSIQTFPDKAYGYFDLPAMEAEKLKKKLNGAILKGKKMKIEQARPRKRVHEDDEADVPAVQSVEPTIETTARKPKKFKKDTSIIRGHRISPERKVKRGWTEVKGEKAKRSKEKPSRPSSRYTDKEELLFQIKTPPNKKDLVKEDRKKNGKKRNSNGDVVHEFERSVVQPSFLRDSAVSTEDRAASSFVDGKGWVDDTGDLLEEEPTTVKRSRARDTPRTTRSSKTKQALSDELSSSSDDDSTPRPAQKSKESRPAKAQDSDESESTSSSGSSGADSKSESEDSDAVSSQASSGREDRASSPNPNASMHPLEALFKKPSKPALQDIAKPSLEVQTSFQFFDHTGDDFEEEMVLGTPFSSQDTRSRGHRSAAPTPDTAHPSRFNSNSSQLGDSDEEDEEEEEGPLTGSQQTPSKTPQLELPAEQSAFEKQFWEKRGELGRGWKRRRREVQKEKRQRETRANKRSW